MASTTAPKHHESTSIWPTLNRVIAGLITLFTAYWGVLLLSGALKKSFGNPEAAAEASAASTSYAAAPEPQAPAPAPAPAAAPAASAAPAQAGAGFEITIKPAGAAGMEFDTKAFTVKAGQKVKVTFENTHPIPQPHNIVFGKPGTKDKVMMAAMAMASSPDAVTKGYIPQGTDVLFHTKLLQPTQSEVLEFTAPAEAGQYPYLCTFPGHGMLMNGIMTVE
jgi:azurin